jgi:hypothetical protein
MSPETTGSLSGQPPAPVLPPPKPPSGGGLVVTTQPACSQIQMPFWQEQVLQPAGPGHSTSEQHPGMGAHPEAPPSPPSLALPLSGQTSVPPSPPWAPLLEPLLEPAARPLLEPLLEPVVTPLLDPVVAPLLDPIPPLPERVVTSPLASLVTGPPSGPVPEDRPPHAAAGTRKLANKASGARIRTYQSYQGVRQPVPIAKWS